MFRGARRGRSGCGDGAQEVTHFLAQSPGKIVDPAGGRANLLGVLTAGIGSLEDAGGKLAGAGLDVYPDEPNVDPRLIRHPNVMTLPHIGSATREGREESGLKVIANIRMWVDGHRPPDQVLTGL